MSFDPATHKYILPPLISLPYSESLANGYGARNASNPKYYSLIVVHGVFMALSFLILLPLGALLGRFFSRRNPRGASQGHAVLGCVALVFTTIGFVVGYFAVGGSSGWGRNPHHYVGVAAYAGLGVSAFAGVFVRQSERKLRKGGMRRGVGLGGMLHNWFGRGIILLGLAQVPMGLYVYGSPLVLYIIYGIVVALWISAWFVLEYINERRGYQSVHESEKWLNASDRDDNTGRYGSSHGQPPLPIHQDHDRTPPASPRRTRTDNGPEYFAPGTGEAFMPSRQLSARERISQFGSRLSARFARGRTASGETEPMSDLTSRPPSSRLPFQPLQPQPPLPVLPVHNPADSQQRPMGGPIMPTHQLDEQFANNPLRDSNTLGQPQRPHSPVSPNLNPVNQQQSSTVSSLSNPPTQPPQAQTQTAYISPLHPPNQPLPLPPHHSPHRRSPSHPPAAASAAPSTAQPQGPPVKVHVQLTPDGQAVQVRRLLPHDEPLASSHATVLAEGPSSIVMPRRRPDGSTQTSAGSASEMLNAVRSSAEQRRIERARAAERAAQRERELDRQRGLGRRVVEMPSPGSFVQDVSAASPSVPLPSAVGSLPPGSSQHQHQHQDQHQHQMQAQPQSPDAGTDDSPTKMAAQQALYGGRESVLSAGELTDEARVKEWRKEKRRREREGRGGRSTVTELD